MCLHCTGPWETETDPPTPVLLKEWPPSQCCSLELLVMMNARRLSGWETACVSREMSFNFNLSSDEFVTTDTWSPCWMVRVTRIKGEALTLAQGDGWQRNVAAKGEQA